MSSRVYPEWVQNQKRKGTTVKKVGNNYYLYKHSSKHVKGKKYPVPVDTYIGRITPDGIEEGTNRKINTDTPEVIVREFGFSCAAIRCCPAEWKSNLPGKWKKVLNYIIFEESPETYLKDTLEMPSDEEVKKAYHAQKGVYSRRMYKLYGVDLQDIKKLSTIYLVKIGKMQFISKISEEQQKVLDKLCITLEVH